MPLKHTNQKSIAWGQAPIAQTDPKHLFYVIFPGKRKKAGTASYDLDEFLNCNRPLILLHSGTEEK